MFAAAVITSLLLAALAVIQVYLTRTFSRRMRAPAPASLPDAKCPKAAVIICIRGKDPSLHECLDAALNQDYPDYAVHIVVDSESDPAWQLVNSVAASNPGVQTSVQTLKDRLVTCSLKCSSLIQAIAGLDRSYEIVALLDTDVVPHRRWLRDLATPLADPAVGVSTGNRWFSLHPSSLSNLARCAWNAAAVVLMYRLKIAWGGSLAIKRTVIDQGELLDLWSRTYCEDTPINPALNRLGLRLELTPSAIVAARDDCSFSEVLDWVTRQLIACRLHHSGWSTVALHAVAASAAMASAALLILASITLLDWVVLALTVGTLSAYFLALVVLLVGVERSRRESSIRPNQHAKSVSVPASTGRLFIAVIAAHALYALGLTKAATARVVEWRGVCYRILDDNQLRVIEIKWPNHGSETAPGSSDYSSPQI